MIESAAHIDVFLIPSCVKAAIERRAFPLTVLFDLVKLKTFLSDEDIALIYQLNNSGSSLVFGTVANPSLYDRWTKTQEAAKIYDNICVLSAMHQTLTKDRLITNDPNATGEAYTIQTLSSAGILITIYPGFFARPESNKYKTQLVRSYLKLLYEYTNYSTVSRDSVFPKYVANLYAGIR